MKISEKDLQKIIQQEIRENLSEQELSEINMLQRAWRGANMDLGQVWKAGREKSQYDSAIKNLQKISSNALPKFKDELLRIKDAIEASDKEYPQVTPLVQQVEKMLGNFDNKIKKVIPDHGSEENDLSADEEGQASATPAQESPVQEVFNFGAASDAAAAGRLKQDLGILKQKILKTYGQVKPLIRKIETFKPTSKEKKSDLETDEPQQQPAKKPAAPAAAQSKPTAAPPAQETPAETPPNLGPPRDVNATRFKVSKDEAPPTSPSAAVQPPPEAQQTDNKTSTGAPAAATTSVTTPSAPGGPSIASGDVRAEPEISSTDGSNANFVSGNPSGGNFIAPNPNATQEPQAAESGIDVDGQPDEQLSIDDKISNLKNQLSSPQLSSIARATLAKQVKGLIQQKKQQGRYIPAELPPPASQRAPLEKDDNYIGERKAKKLNKKLSENKKPVTYNNLYENWRRFTKG